MVGGRRKQHRMTDEISYFDAVSLGRCVSAFNLQVNTHYRHKLDAAGASCIKGQEVMSASDLALGDRFVLLMS